MSNHTTRLSVQFSELAKRPVTVTFDQPDSSSDGGTLLLKGCDQTLGLSTALAACLSDTCHPDRISNTLHDLLHQRLYGLACGYEACNDARRLKEDSVQKLLLDRDPVSGQGIASQPTLSRFENAVGSRELLRMSYALADSVLVRHRKRLKRKTRCITLDMDPTDDQCQGQQQLSLFNSHYHGWCFLPMACHVTLDNESEQYLLAHVLRPGDNHASTGANSIMKRLLKRIRYH